MTKTHLVIFPAVTLALSLFFYSSAHAETFYVRTDGGTQQQCTGTKDAPYPGSGSNQPCAFNHPNWALAPQGNNPSRLNGGDTLIIDGENESQYMMGYGAPNTQDSSKCSIYWPWDCFTRPIPSGPNPENPTRILGKGWDKGCSSPPQLWGTERLNKVLNLKGSSNVEVQCLEVTDHSACQEFGPVSCNRSSYPYGEWASLGMEASDSSNVLIKNVNIHGMANKGVLAGRLNNWTVEDVRIKANPFAGWDGDIGADSSSNTGTMTFNRVLIEYNGCGEKYPSRKPYACFSQSQGGYGDGLGTAKTSGNWNFINSTISHNAQDGIDLSYHKGDGTVTIMGTRTEGNAGNQIKSSANTVIYNSLIIGNCAYFNNNPLVKNAGSFDSCRALGNSIVLYYRPGMTSAIANSTVISNGDNLLLSVGGDCDGSEVLKSRNNIFIGRSDFTGGDISTLYFASGENGEGQGKCGGIKLDDDYSIIYGTKNVSTDCANKPHAQCTDPKLEESLVPYYMGNLYDAALKNNSPAIGKGLIITGVPPVDMNGYSRGASWDIGAFQSGSIPTVSNPLPVEDNIGAMLMGAILSAESPRDNEEPPPGEEPEAAPAPDAAAPSVPSGITAAAGSTTEINVIWTASTDNVAVAGYKIFRDGTQIGTSNGAAYTDSGLTPDKSYTYMVSAYDAAGNESDQSGPATGTTLTPPDTLPPAVPMEFAAKVVSSTAINLVWTVSMDNVGVVGYKVFRDGTEIASPTAPSYADTGLTPSTEYSYAVLAYDAAGNQSAKTNVVKMTTLAPPDLEAPSQPVGLISTVKSDTEVDLSWTASTDNVAVSGYKIFRDGVEIASGTAASYTDKEVTGPKTHAYTVLALDAAGNASAQSAAINVNVPSPPDTESPTMPTDVSVNALSPTEVKLTWTASTDNVGVTAYKITRDGTDVGTVTETSFTETGLKETTAYSYTVQASDAAGNTSAVSAAVTVTTPAPPDVEPPSVPSELKGAAVSTSEIQLSWKAAADNRGVAGYKVYRDNVIVDQTVSPQHTDKGLEASTSYTYQIAAYDEAGNASGLSESVKITTSDPPDTTAPSVPSSVKASAKSASEIEVSWRASTDAVGVSGYKVFRDGAQIATSSETSYQDTLLESSKAYTYTVQAYDAAGNQSALSAKASATTLTPKDTTAPSTPTGLQALSISTSQIDLAWQKASDDSGAVSGYKVFRDSVLIASTETESYSDTGLKSATAFSYNVLAFDAAGNSSAPSTSASAATQDPEPTVPDPTTPTDPDPTVPPAPSEYSTYYVRDDGGSPAQCNGLYDAPYSGGSNNCAWSHPAEAIGGVNSGQRIQGGDTLIIDGKSHINRGQQAQYMIGFGMPNTNTSVCAAAYPYGCELNAIPSGPNAQNPTKILGKGWDSGCANPPQLWGTNSVNQVLTLSGTNHVHVKCLEITDHSNCGFRVGSPQCSENYPNPGTYGRKGIYAYKGSDWTFDHVNIHGMSKVGVHAGGIDGLTVTNSNVDGNYFAGWDGDIGQNGNESSNSGKLSFKNFTVRYNGYSEAYPLITTQGDGVNYSNATDQNHNPPGYGDGFGFYKTAGSFEFINADISHNAQDGIDLLYHTTNELVSIQRSILQGNDGNQAKINGSTHIENSIIIGNCSYPAVAGKIYNKDSFVTCRAGGDALLLGFPTGATHKFYNNTVWTEGSSLFLLKNDHWGQTCDGSESFTVGNSVLQGKTGTSLIIDQRSGSCSSIKPVFNHTLSHNFSSNPTPEGNRNLNNTPPKFVGSISLGADDNISNVYLQSSSPAVGKADVTLNVLSSSDFNNFVRGASWDMGAIQYGSTPAN